MATSTEIPTVGRRHHAVDTNKGGSFANFANGLASISFSVADYFEDSENAIFISKVAYIVLLMLLLAVAGIMSGLTLALFTLDTRALRAHTNGSSARLKQQAMRVLPLLENSHWTLCTLLVCNAAAVETLPLVLGHIVHALAAVVLSVILVLVFGEILPQAFFAKYALPVSSFFAGFISVMMVVTAPISWTAGWALDALVGHKEQSLLRRTELKQLLKLRRRHQKHQKISRQQPGDFVDTPLLSNTVGTFTEASALLQAQQASPAKESSLLAVLKRWTADRLPSTKMKDTESLSSVSSSSDEEEMGKTQTMGKTHTHRAAYPYAIEDNEMKIMLGALSLSELHIKDVMPAKATNVFFLEKNEVITRDLVAAVFNHGFSRIPVFCAESKVFVSYFLARSLISFIYPQTAAAAKGKYSSGMAEIFIRKKKRLLEQSEDKNISDEWVASHDTVVQDLPQHEPLFCSADTLLGEVYEDLITLQSPLVIVLKSESSTPPPPQLEHTGDFTPDYGTMAYDEPTSLSFSVILARQKVTVAEPVSPLMPIETQTFSSKAHGQYQTQLGSISSLGASPEPKFGTSVQNISESSLKDLPQYSHFQQQYLKKVKEGPTSGLLTFEDVVEVVHGISIVDEFDWESASRIQSEWRNRLALARVIQKGTSFCRPPGANDKPANIEGTEVSRRLVKNWGLETTTRTSGNI